MKYRRQTVLPTARVSVLVYMCYGILAVIDCWRAQADSGLASTSHAARPGHRVRLFVGRASGGPLVGTSSPISGLTRDVARQGGLVS